MMNDSIFQELLSLISTTQYQIDDSMLERALRNINCTSEYVLYQNGIKTALDDVFRKFDILMLEKLHKIDITDMRIRDKINFALIERVELYRDIIPNFRSFIRKIISFYSHPKNIADGTLSMGKTVDEIWYWAGDRSTDFNYYSKRGILILVYISTLNNLINDYSHDLENTRTFINNRIDNVMTFHKVKHKIKSFFNNKMSM